MNIKIINENSPESLFAEVEFPDNQTVLQIYGNITAEKLKAMVAAINEVIRQHD